MVGSKGEENYVRFESRKFRALGYKEVLKSRYCIEDRKKNGIETKILHWRPQGRRHCQHIDIVRSLPFARRLGGDRRT